MDSALTGDGAVTARYSPRHQTRQTNDLFCTPGIDGRRWEARAYKDAVRGMLRDLGVEQHELTDTTKLQIRTAASLAVQVEQAQARALKGERVDLFHLVRMQNSLSRTLWALGGLPQEAAHRSSRSG